ncbi:MAG: protein disulfide oxidoreductase [Chromatiales bacterium]|nr:protein disulfide oxidoreductase [Chromatiales bacterium]
MSAHEGLKRWGKRLLELLLLLAVIMAVGWWRAGDMASGAAPALIAYDLEGNLFRLDAVRDGPVLVHFWASWCPVCRTQDGAIDSLAKDAHVITVAMQSGADDAIETYLQEEGLSFPALADPDGRIARAWGVNGVPASFIVGSDGRIHFRELGYTTGLGLRLRLWWAGLNTDDGQP